MPISATKTDQLDRAAMLLSGLCLLHCTALPLALAALQAYGAALVPRELDGGWFHAAMAAVLVGVGGAAFAQGYARHGRFFPPAAGAVGTALLIAGAFASGLGELAEHGLTVLGTVVLLVAHSRNRRELAAHHHHDASCRGKH